MRTSPPRRITRRLFRCAIDSDTTPLYGHIALARQRRLPAHQEHQIRTHRRCQLLLLGTEQMVEILEHERRIKDVGRLAFVRPLPGIRFVKLVKVRFPWECRCPRVRGELKCDV